MSTFNPRDLVILIKAVEKGQQVLNGVPKGAVFPGWFLTVQQNEGYDTIIPPFQLSLSDLIHISAVIDSTVGGSRVTNAARNCDAAMKDDLLRQLKIAEDQAAKIPALKKRLEEL